MVPARTPLRSAVVVVLAIGVVAAGGYALLTDEPGRPSQASIDNASERFASLDGFAATVESTVRLGNRTTRTVRRVTTRPGTGKYRSVAVGGNSTGYDVTVSNGSATWLYDEDNETVRRIDVDPTGNATGAVLSGRYVERVMTAAFDHANETTSGVSALPMVSSRSRPAASGTLPSNGSSLALDVSYAGVERTSGRRAYVFELTQPDDADGSLERYTARLWVDAEWFVALKQRTNFTVDGERYVSTANYRNLSFDPDLSDVSFRFDPPPDANVTTVTGPSIQRYDSREALARNATAAVPDPSVPSDYEFDQGARTVGEQSSLTLQYTNGTGSLSITVSNATDAAPTEGTRVEVGSATGRLQTFGATRLLGWRCDGRSYTVIGSNVGNETVTDVARSIGCE